MSRNYMSTDDDYFRSYGDMSIHLDMIQDEVRTKTYRYAILKNYEVFYKKVVLDVGAGTGILSMFCVQAGAAKVYAIEASGMAAEAEKVVKANGMEGKIKVIHGRVEEAELPEKVDVIVSEWMGYFLFYESMLHSVLYARDNFLKKGGLMFPSVASLSLVVLADDEVDMDGSDVWESVNRSYDLDMTSLRVRSLQCFTERVHILPVDPRQIVAFPVEIFKMDLEKEPLSSLEGRLCESSFLFKSFGSTNINGFCAFFEVIFRGNIILSTSPYSDITHWNQSIMYLRKPIPVEQDDSISGTIVIKPAPHDKRGLSISISYEKSSSQDSGDRFVVSKVKDTGPTKQTFLMDRFA